MWKDPADRVSFEEDPGFRQSTAIGAIFEEEPVPLNVFVQDKAYLNADWMLSDIQYGLVRVIERVYLKDTFALMAQEFGGYWADPIPMKNLIAAQWGKGGGKDSTVRIAAMRVAYLLS